MISSVMKLLTASAGSVEYQLLITFASKDERDTFVAKKSVEARKIAANDTFVLIPLHKKVSESQNLTQLIRRNIMS